MNPIMRMMLARQQNPRHYKWYRGGSDGSTLNLDFTQMSELDSRFTFSRSSTATVINSSGLVQYAAGNFFTNTAWLGSTLPTNWSLLIGSGTTTWNANGSVTMTAATSERPAINHSAVTVAPGLPHTFGFLATGVSGSPQVSQVISSNLTDTYAINGVTVSGTAVVQNNDVVSCTFTPSTTSVTARIGPGSTGSISNTSLTASRPQFNIGSALQQYLQNTSTAGAYHAPRFDYDPTTLAARGLLIEGSATNLLSYSEDFSNPAWTKSGTNGAMTLTGTAPDNAATSRLLEENTTSYAKHSLERSVTISAGMHTLSVWLKEPSSNSRRYAHIQLADGQAIAARYTIVVDLQTGTITASGATNGTAGAPTGTAHSITAYPNGWYRVTISMNHVASPSYPVVMLGDSSALFGGNNQPFYSATTPYKGLLVWGAQLEAGSGSSSYIPTGSSTVQRAAESCSMTGANFSSWFNASEGTVFSHHIANGTTSTTRFVGSLRASDQNYIDVLRYPASSFYPEQFVQSGASLVAQLSDIGLTSATARKSAAAFKANDFALSVNGRSVITDNSGAMPTVNPDTLWIGSYANSFYFNGTIASLKFWPTRLPNATLQSLTQ